MQCTNIALHHALDSVIERKIVLSSDECSRTPLLLDLTINMQVTLEGLWVRKLHTTGGTSSLPFFSFGSCKLVVSFDLSLA